MRSELPDQTRVFQIAGWMWFVYLFLMVAVDLMIYAAQPVSPNPLYYILNGLPAILFLAISYSRWLKEHGESIAPILILIITLTPILINPLFNIHLPPAPLSNLEGMVLRQLPVLFIGLVLVAWNYRLATIIIYSLGVNLGEVAILYVLGLSGQILQSPFIYIIAIRTVCFVVVGIFINQLINLLRSQQASLLAANHKLTHYSSTLENLAVSRERNRMSRELHDTVVHTLSGLAVQLETTKAYWDLQPGTAKGLLESSLKATREGLQETRRAIKAMRASPLDDLGLVGAINYLLDNAAQRGDLSIDRSLPEKIILSPDIEQALYRITQEAVENVLHHANAQHLFVHVEIVDRDVFLVIQDDGIGFNPEKSLQSGHYGLAGMRERAKLAGGDLSIDSQPGHGTKLQLGIHGCVK